MGTAQDGFVQAVARDYAAFYDKDTAAKITKYFTEKAASTDTHTNGVVLVNHKVKQIIGQPHWDTYCVNDVVAEVIVAIYGLPPKTPDKNIVEYSNMGKAQQESFVQAVARDYAAFYDKDTAAKIIAYFTQKTVPTLSHADGVILVNYEAKKKIGQPNWQAASVNDCVANVIIARYGMPPKAQQH